MLIEQPRAWAQSESPTIEEDCLARFAFVQDRVAAAGADLELVLQIVTLNLLQVVPRAAGVEVELIDETGSYLPRHGGGRPVSSSSDIAGIIAAPISFDGEPAGRLLLAPENGHLFRPVDRTLLQLHAGLIGIGMVGHSQAIAEFARGRADRRFKATFDQAAVGIAHVATDGSFILVNDRFCQICGHPRDALIQTGFQGITHPEDLDADMAHVRDLLAGRADTYSTEKRYIRADSTLIWINLTVSLVRKADGSPDFFVSVIEDISARRAAQMDAEHDQLTGLLNRRGALRQLEAALSANPGVSGGLAVAFIDLDGLKAVNDAFGHLEGDRCLIAFAGALRKSFRGRDRIARLGGDEFLAVFCIDSAAAVEGVLGRLAARIEGICADEPWTVSASAGVAIVDFDTKLRPEAIIAAADGFMYRAKHSAGGAPIIEKLSD